MMSIRKQNKMLFDFIVESNYLEGVTDFHSAITASSAFLYLLEHTELTAELILKVHQMTMKHHLSPKEAGKYRKVNVRVRNYVAPSHDLVIGLMNEWIAEVNRFMALNKRKPSTVIKHHVNFEKIHPFVDGNGRIGRMLMNWELFHLGMPLKIYRYEYRSKYYDLFEHEDR